MSSVLKAGREAPHVANVAAESKRQAASPCGRTFIMKIQFHSPHQRMHGERKSKLLHPDSNLCRLVVKLKAAVTQRLSLAEDRRAMAPHIELVSRDEDRSGFDVDETLRVRVPSVEGRSVEVCDAGRWGLVGRAFALVLDDVPGYRHRAHVTVAFLGSAVGEVEGNGGAVLRELREMAVSLATSMVGGGSGAVGRDAPHATSGL